MRGGGREEGCEDGKNLWIVMSFVLLLSMMILMLVTVSNQNVWMMTQEDDDAREVVLEQLLKDGLDLKFNLKFIRVEHELPETEGDFPLIRVVIEQGGEEMVRFLSVLLLSCLRFRGALLYRGPSWSDCWIDLCDRGGLF